MAGGRFAWGIDVGNRALKAVKLIREGDRLVVDEFEVIEHETVLSNSGDNRPALIQSALQNFVARHPVKGGVAAIGVSGQSSFARFIKLPPVEQKKIPEIVRFEAIQQIPFPLDDVEWSYQLFQDPESPEVEVGIFAMRRELINEHMKYFTDVDLNVQVVQMNPLAVYNAMYYDSRLQGTTMIIDMGAENTDLIIAEGENVWLRSIPIGGNNFTEALVKAFKMNFTKAEEMKRTASTSKYARQIFQAMRPVFADLVAEVQRSIGFYASTHRDSRIKRIIALGGTFRLPGLQKYLQQNLQLDVERIDGLSAGAPADGKLATVFNENLLSMPAAYGLALQAMGQAKINSSLLPQYIRRAKLWKEKTKWFGAAAALFIAGTGVAYGSIYLNGMQYESSSAQQARQEIDRVKRRAETYDHNWSEVEQSSTSGQTIQNVSSLLAYRNIWPDLLADIRKALPIPQPEVTSGVADTIKKIPRDKREQIIIDSITSVYRSDLGTVLADPGWAKYCPDPTNQNSAAPMAVAAAPSGDTAAAAPATPARGYLITVVCLTPNAQGSTFVVDTMIKNLQKIAPAPGQKMTFAVAKAEVNAADHIANIPTRMSALSQAYTASAARMTAPGAPPAPGGDVTRGIGTGRPPMAGGASPGATGDDAMYADRVTGEDVRQDWEVKVCIAVTLDPASPAAPAQSADASGATTQPAPAAPAAQ